jgi:hypothetical protein
VDSRHILRVKVHHKELLDVEKVAVCSGHRS